jgi:hypothetical protein
MLEQDVFASMILQRDQVIKLCLKLFGSGNLIHICPGRRKSHQIDIRFELREKKNYMLRSTEQSKEETENINLAHA